MHLLILFLLTLTILVLLWNAQRQFPPQLQRPSTNDEPALQTDDARVAAAALLYVVATQDGSLTPAKEHEIISLLHTVIGMPWARAQDSFLAGRRLAAGIDGNLNERLHRLAKPIERTCTDKEKQEMVEMIRQVAGPNAERLGSLRDSLSRLSATLLNG